MLLEQTVKQPVDEAPRLLGAELLGELDGLVHYHQLRSLALVKHLVDRQAQDVAVDRRHALQPPVVGLAADHRVDLLAVIDGAAHQLLGVEERLRDPPLLARELPPTLSAPGGRPCGPPPPPPTPPRPPPPPLPLHL